MLFVSLTAFPINVGVKFSLKEAIFDLGGLFVVGNIQEGVGLGTQRSTVSRIFLHKHGAPQLSFVTAHADIKNMFKKKSGHCPEILSSASHAFTYTAHSSGSLFIEL